jgi:hypothetical protein
MFLKQPYFCSQPLIAYSNIKELIDGFEEVIVERAIEKHVELTSRKTEELKTTSIDDLMKKIKQ